MPSACVIVRLSESILNVRLICEEKLIIYLYTTVETLKLKVNYPHYAKIIYDKLNLLKSFLCEYTIKLGIVGTTIAIHQTVHKINSLKATEFIIKAIIDT